MLAFVKLGWLGAFGVAVSALQVAAAGVQVKADKIIITFDQIDFSSVNRDALGVGIKAKFYAVTREGLDPAKGPLRGVRGNGSRDPNETPPLPSYVDLTSGQYGIHRQIIIDTRPGDTAFTVRPHLILWGPKGGVHPGSQELYITLRKDHTTGFWSVVSSHGENRLVGMHENGRILMYDGKLKYAVQVK